MIFIYFRTALAEAELEYKDHQSKCATIKLRLVKLPKIFARYENKPIFALTWTTTPWTLIANQALAFSPTANYCLAENEEGNLYIVATELLEKNSKKIGSLRLIETFLGISLVLFYHNTL